ncbi:IS66 family transposase, partial [Streptococcus pneumoniae]|uniref:IS66 family transposase n=1 Tax=Streptococcus pneumoniae TaxID=1313 RepID=UPI00070C775E
ELVFIPAQLKRVDHIQHAYKCQTCSKNNPSDKIVKAPVPKAPLAHSFGSVSIIAHTIHQKFNLKVPNYRQEEDWARMGLPITRKEISNWHIKASQYYLESLYNLLREKLLEQPLLHADETSYRVLESDSQLTYYWTFLSGKAEKQGITLYHHDQRRSGLVVQEFLGDYSGYVHCDMWSAYRQLEEAKLVGCWAHVRRKFFEATPKQADKSSLGAKGLAYCDQLFSLERDWEDLSADERLQRRQEELYPLMENFFAWCRRQSVLPGSKLGRAIEYSLKYEETFKTILKDGHLVLSNNLAERAIKSLVMGRKNWLFSQSFEGAKATAIIMSLLETAKRHQLNSEKYLSYLLESLPNEETLVNKEVLEAYLPWTKVVQEKCK